MAGARPGVPRVIAIDTNLFTLVLLCHRFKSKGLGVPERERELQEVWGRQDTVSLEQLDALWRIFERAHRRIVTQHIVAETFSNRGRKRLKEWRHAIGLVPEYNVEERSCRICDLHALTDFREIMEELGPSDAGLIYTAKREGATIVTEDQRLRDLAYHHGVPALALDQLGRL
jgi:predicted nucleic acid-binding protein